MILQLSFISIVLVLWSCLCFADMEADIELFRDSHTEISQVLSARNIDRYQFVFVGGYMNEVLGDDYLKINANTIHQLGARDVSRIFPSSLASVEKNRAVIASDLIQHAKKSGKPVILMGHSKGGLEALATVLEYPELIRNKIVSEVVLIQAPVGGNTYLDQQGFIKKLFTVGLNISPGHNSLRTNEIRKMIELKIATMSAEDLSMISSKVKYVISSKAPNKLSKVLRAASEYTGIKAEYDGLVARNDMWIPGFGTVIGDLDADHLEYVLAKKLFMGESQDPLGIEAFTKSLLVNIFKSRNTRINEYKELTKAVNESRPTNQECSRFFP